MAAATTTGKKDILDPLDLTNVPRDEAIRRLTEQKEAINDELTELQQEIADAVVENLVAATERVEDLQVALEEIQAEIEAIQNDDGEGGGDDIPAKVNFLADYKGLEARAAAAADPNIPIFDFRRELPKGIEVRGEHSLVKQPDGALALNLKPGAYIKVNFPSSLPPASSKRINGWTLTFDIKVDRIPDNGISLLQSNVGGTNMPEARSEAYLVPVKRGDGSSGRLYMANTPGVSNTDDIADEQGEGVLKAGVWNRMTLTHGEERLVNSNRENFLSGNNYYALNSVVGKKLCRKYFHHFSADKRFSLDKDGNFFMFARADDLHQVDIQIKYIRFEPRTLPIADVTKLRMVDAIFSEFANDMIASEAKTVKLLSLNGIYRRPHPIWMDGSFAGEFADCFVENTSLDNASPYESLQVYHRVLAQLTNVDISESRLARYLNETDMQKVTQLVDCLQKSFELFRRWRTASKRGNIAGFVKRLTAAIGELKPDEFLFVQGGVVEAPMLYVIQRDTAETFTFIVINTGVNGISYHPINGEEHPKLKYQTAIPVSGIPLASIIDDCYWGILLYLPLCTKDPEVLYTKVMPYIFPQPWEHYCAIAQKSLPWRTTTRSNLHPYRTLLEGFHVILIRSGLDKPKTKYVALCARWQFIKFTIQDLHAVKNLTDSDRKLLTIGTQQLAHAAGKFCKKYGKEHGSQILDAVRKDIVLFDEKADALPLTMNGSSKDPPHLNSTDYTVDNVWPFFHQPLTDRLIRLEDTEGYAGPPVTTQNHMPFDMTKMPRSVKNAADAIRALRLVERLCNFLQNQAGLIKNSNFLRVALLQHTFTHVIPVPLGLGAPPGACIWMDWKPKYSEQQEFLIMLGRIHEHWAANSCSVFTDKSFDGTRIVIEGVIYALCDVVLRKEATDFPSEFSLIYAKGWGISYSVFAKQAETIELHTPELNIAMTAILDYHARLKTNPHQVLFAWENSLGPCQAWARLEGEVARNMCFPADSIQTLLNGNPYLFHFFPEVRVWTNIAFMWKVFMCTQLEVFPGVGAYNQFHADIKWGFNAMKNEFENQAFGTVLQTKAKFNGHRWPSGAIAARYTLPHPATNEDDILHIPNFKCFADTGERLQQKDIELLLSYLTVPYMRIPLVLGFFATNDRIHTLMDTNLRALLDAVVFEPGRHLPLGYGAAPEEVPAPDIKQIAAPYGLLLNEVYRSPEGLLASIRKLLAQARELDSRDPGASNVPIILYICRVIFRVYNYVTFVVRLADADNQDQLFYELRDLHSGDDSALIDNLREVATDLWDLIYSGQNSIYLMLEDWLIKTTRRMAAVREDGTIVEGDGAREDREAKAARKRKREQEKAKGGADDSDGDSSEEEEIPPDETQEEREARRKKRQAKSGGSAKSDKMVRRAANLYAHMILMFRSVTENELKTDVLPLKSMVSAFLFLQTRHTWNCNLLEIPEPELFEIMQVQRRTIINCLTGWGKHHVHPVMEACVRVMTATGFIKEKSGASIRPWALIAGSTTNCQVTSHNGRFTLARGAGMRGPVEVNDSLGDALERFKDSHVAVVVWTPGSGPALNLLRIIKGDLCAQFPHVRFLKVLAGPETEALDVRVVPTILFYNNNQPLKQHTLAGPTQEILRGKLMEVFPNTAIGATHVDQQDDGHHQREMVTVQEEDVQDEEISMQTWNLTMRNNQLKALDTEIQQNGDVMEVFQTNGTMQCVVKESAVHRDWISMLGRDHDIHYWKDGDPNGGAEQILDRDYDPGYLPKSETWIVPLFEPIRLAFFDDPRIEWEIMMPEKELDPNATVAYMVVLHPKLGTTFREVFLYKDYSCVQIYDVESYGRRFYRTLIFTTDTRFTLRELQPSTQARPAPWRPWQRHLSLSMMPNDAGPAGVSCVVYREHNARNNISKGKEMFLPQRYLYGLVPQALLDRYMMWQDTNDNIRGYDRTTATPDHYIFIEHFRQVGHPAVPMPQGEELEVCSKIYKVPFQETALERKMMLCNVLYAKKGSALHSLAQVLSRIENVAHILVWTFNTSGDPANPLTIDLVHLPRLKLTFSVRNGQLYSVDHADLYVTNDRSELTSALIRGMPHSLLLSNDNKEVTVLVPAIRVVRPQIGSCPFTTELVMDRSSSAGATWRRNVESPYFLYPVHISLSFLQTPTLASALNLLFLRYQFRDYADTARLVDAIGTDTDFSKNPEELQLFKHLATLNSDCHPDAHAVRCKIAIAMLDAPILVPWCLRSDYAKMTMKLSHVASAVFLSVFDQGVVTAECELIQQKINIIARELAKYPEHELREILNPLFDPDALLEISHAQRTKMERFLNDVQEVAFRELRLNIRDDELKHYIVMILNKEDIPYLFKCLIKNREFYIDSYTNSKPKAECRFPEPTVTNPWKFQQKPPDLVGAFNLKFNPERFANVNLRKAFPKCITSRTVLQEVAHFLGNSENLDGRNLTPEGYDQGTGRGFLFVYGVLTGGVKVRFANNAPGCNITLGNIISNLIKDFYTPSLMSEILLVLRHNPQLCVPGVLPVFKDTRKNKQEIITTHLEEGEKTIPLKTFFIDVAEALAQHKKTCKGVPNPSTDAPNPAPREVDVPLSNPPLVGGYFALRPQDGLRLPSDTCGQFPNISNTQQSKLFLHSFDPAHLVSAPAVDRSILVVQEQELRDLALFPLSAVVSSFSADAPIVVKANRAACGLPPVPPELPFDVTGHPATVTPVAIDMVQRLQEDSKRHADTANEGEIWKVNGLRDMDLKPLQDAANSGKLDEILARLTDLEAKLNKVKDSDTLYIKTGIHTIVASANFVDPSDQETSLAKIHFMLRRYGAQECPLWFEFTVGCLLSTQAFEDWHKLNPYLDPDVFRSVTQLVIHVMLHAGRLGHINRTLAAVQTLAKSLKNYRKTTDVNAKNLQMSAIQQKADFLATLLVQQRHCIFQSPPAEGNKMFFDPRFLVFEFTWNIIMRKAQVDMVNEFMDKLRRNESSVRQMIMGAGKTTVVGPLLCLLLGSGDHLVMQVVPNALLEFSRGVLRSTFSSIVQKRISTFIYDRTTKVDPSLYRKLQTVIKTCGVLIASPTSVKSCQLKLIETLDLISNPNAKKGDHTRTGGSATASNVDPRLEEDAKELQKLLMLFRNGVCLLDEVDMLLHPLKSELNFPVGQKELIDFNPLRWSLPMHLVDALFYSLRSPPKTTGSMWEDSQPAISLLRKIESVLQKGYAEKTMQAVPHPILLDDGFYDRNLKKLFAEWAFFWMELQNFTGLSKEEAIKYVTEGPDADPKLREAVVTVAPMFQKMLNLVKDWLNSYLPHVMKKVDRVTFGIMTKKDRQRAQAKFPNMPRSRFMLAIPFVGKDVPSESSEFAHPDIIIGLTILAYRYEGLRYSDFVEIIAQVCEDVKKEPGKWKDRKTVKLYNSWIKEAGGSVVGKAEYRDLVRMPTISLGRQGSHTSDDGQGLDGPTKVVSLMLLKQSNNEHMKPLFKMLKGLPDLIYYYLNIFLFPTYMRMQKLKLSNSGQELGGDALFRARVGFSGTPSNLMPIELGKCIFERCSDGQIVHTLTDTSVVDHTYVEPGWTPQSLLEYIAKSGKFHALIDTGALITGLSNLEVAQTLLRLGLDGIQGVVFLDELDRKMILVRETKRVLRLEECGIALEHRFAFYDQIHTTGMDIKHTPNAVAATTLGKDMTFRDYAQGTYRMRGIAKGQRIHLLIIPEIRELIRRELSHTKHKAEIAAATPQQVLNHVTAWLAVNQMHSERLQFNQLCLQNVANVYRKQGYGNLLRATGQGDFTVANNVRENKQFLNAYQSLKLFHEDVNYDIWATIREPRKFSEVIEALVEGRTNFIPEGPKGADVVEHIKKLVSEQKLTDGNDRHLEVEQQQEQEQEQEKEQEQEQEIEIEVTQVIERAWSREDEAPKPWKFSWLGHQETLKEKLVLYDAHDFHLLRRQPIAFPNFLQVSTNYFDKRWDGDRRIKNVCVVMEYMSDVSTAKDRVNPPATVPKEHHLPEVHRTLDLFSIDEKPELAQHNAKDLIRIDFEQTHPTFDQIKGEVVAFEHLLNLLKGGEYRKESFGRKYCVLSLIEAETIRRIMHVKKYKSALVDGKKVEMCLRISPHDNLVMDESSNYRQARAHLYENLVAWHSLRFLDCEMHFRDPQLNFLLKGVQNSTPFERKFFFEHIIGCKRRAQKSWEKAAVSRVFSMQSEFSYTHQRALGLRVRELNRIIGLSDFEVFKKWDYGEKGNGRGLLEPANILVGMQWLGLKPTDDDILDFMQLANPTGEMLVSREQFFTMLKDPQEREREEAGESNLEDEEDSLESASPCHTRSQGLSRQTAANVLSAASTTPALGAPPASGGSGGGGGGGTGLSDADYEATAQRLQDELAKLGVPGITIVNVFAEKARVEKAMAGKDAAWKPVYNDLLRISKDSSKPLRPDPEARRRLQNIVSARKQAEERIREEIEAKKKAIDADVQAGNIKDHDAAQAAAGLTPNPVRGTDNLYYKFTTNVMPFNVIVIDLCQFEDHGFNDKLWAERQERQFYSKLKLSGYIAPRINALGPQWVAGNGGGKLVNQYTIAFQFNARAAMSFPFPLLWIPPELMSDQDNFRLYIEHNQICLAGRSPRLSPQELTGEETWFLGNNDISGSEFAFMLDAFGASGECEDQTYNGITWHIDLQNKTATDVSSGAGTVEVLERRRPFARVPEVTAQSLEWATIAVAVDTTTKSARVHLNGKFYVEFELPEGVDGKQAFNPARYSFQVFGFPQQDAHGAVKPDVDLRWIRYWNRALPDAEVTAFYNEVSKEDEWRCQRCTVIHTNKPHALKCDTCQTQRAGVGGGGGDHREAPIVTGADQISCPVCTLIQAAGNATCEMCGSELNA